MNHILHDMGKEALRQLFGLREPRGGKIVLSRHAFQKMTEYQLDRDTIENAFRHGRRGRPGQIIHKYARYSVGLYYKRLDSPIQKDQQSEPEHTYLITTCWKGR